ncbi:MAG: Holliday junction resolvase RuvX [Dehalococcoidia bacterium]
MGSGGRLLGLDVGERRIGVAVSEGAIAVPLAIIEHTNRASDIARIVDIAQRERVETIVIGLPISLSGEEHEQARLTRKFGDQLAEQTPVPVTFHDERYSSVQAAGATDAMLPSKPARRPRVTPRDRRRHLDDRAAAVILQSYLDAREKAE